MKVRSILTPTFILFTMILGVWLPIIGKAQNTALEDSRQTLKALGDTLTYIPIEEAAENALVFSKEQFIRTSKQFPDRYKAVCFQSIDTIPEEISLQSNLETISVLDWQFQGSKMNYVADDFESLPRLRELRIIGAISPTICERLCSNPNLETIHFGVINLEKLGESPMSIRLPIGLKEFRTFDLHAIPKQIADCQKLEKLYASSLFWGNLNWHPQFDWTRQIPSYVYELRALKELELFPYDSQPITIDHRIAQLSQLECLTMSIVDSIATEISECKKLKMANFQDLGTFGWKSLCRATSLESLFVLDSCKGAVPPTIGDLRNLRRLELIRLGIERLPTQFSLLRKLEYLVLGDFISTGIDQHLFSLNRIPKNDLKFIPNDFALSPFADTLLISNTMISNVFFLRKNIHLSCLILSNNEIRMLPAEIGQFKNLRELYLWGNQLKTLPNSFLRLTSLTVLNLANNKFKQFPRALMSNNAPREINLSSNQIHNIPQEIFHLDKTEMIDLSHNLITTVPEEILQMKSLIFIDLRGNPLDTLNLSKEVKAKLIFDRMDF